MTTELKAKKEKKKKSDSGLKYLGMALLIFLGIATEGIYAFLLEPVIFKIEMSSYSTTQSIIHWSATIITWGVFAWLITRLAKKKYGFNLFEKRPTVQIWQWCIIAVMATAALINSYYDWHGFKVIKEFISHGALEFTFQYLYYMMETVMFLLIIVFGQMAFEKWFHNNKIPFGGILVALTWGLGHWFTKGALSTGIITAILGFCLGSVYLLLNRNIKLSYIVLFIMFIF